MVVGKLLKQEFLRSFRSQAFYKGLAVKLLMGFMALYFIVIFVVMGFFLGDMLGEADANLTPLELVNGASLYVLLSILVFRFFMQGLGTVNLEFYQTLPIKRNTLVNLLLLKPLFQPANYLVLLVVVPFALRSVVQWQSGLVAMQLIVNTLLLVWFNVWLSAFLKRRFGSSLIALLVLVGVGASFGALEYFNIFSLFDISMKIFGFLVITPFGWLATLLVAFAAYSLNLLFFSKNYYPERFNEKLNKNDNRITGRFSFLEKYGTIGELIQLQMRLIFRHKRTKSLIVMSAVFLLYGLLFYTNDIYANSAGWLVFIGLVLTGMASMMYGQWAISWESNYFDAIMTKNLDARTYIKTYFTMLIVFNLISFTLTTPYFFMGMRIVYLHLAMLLYNTGVNVFLMLYFASYNNKRIDLMAKSSFNYQGTSYKSFLMVLPLMGLPPLLAFLLQLFMSFEYAMMVFALMGLVGIALLPYQINVCTKNFVQRKYFLAQGFREKE